MVPSFFLSIKANGPELMNQMQMSMNFIIEQFKLAKALYSGIFTVQTDVERNFYYAYARPVSTIK